MPHDTKRKTKEENTWQNIRSIG